MEYDKGENNQRKKKQADLFQQSVVIKNWVQRLDLDRVDEFFNYSPDALP